MARFFLRYKLKAKCINDIEQDLDTGDVVLLSGDDLTYLTSLGSGTWNGFSRCAFVIRTGPGARGLLLCHADAVPAPDSPDSQPVVIMTKLSHELKSGLVSFAVVRKLAQPLSVAEKQRVRDFANRSVGKRMNERANIFMADPHDSRLQRLNCLSAVFGRNFERFFCSEFVAQMLVVAGRVHRKHNTVALDFLPNNSDGHVLRTPIALQCPASGSNSVSARTHTSSKVQVQSYARASLNV